MVNRSEILARYARRQVTADEQQAFQEWLKTLSPEEMEAVVDEYGDLVASLPASEEQPNTELLRAIHEAIDAIRPARVHFLRRWRWAAAAALIATISLAVWLTNKPDTSTRHTTASVAPGKNGAILTLSDGTQVVLDSLGNGVVAAQNGAQVVLQNGQLTYELTDSSTTEIAYNTMNTPKGRQFFVTLPDGTKVWLNAASSIRYPTVFTGKERRVDIKGEAYFEVAKNADMPFRVNADGKAEIEVLGTHFNVTAYDNDPVLNITLVEGSVKVNGKTLKPGQQAQIAGDVRVIDHADIEKVMAWKNGLFNFEGAKLNEVMKQLERWYDIEVVYANGIPDIEFGGEMTKDIPLERLLVVLEKSGIHFRLEDRHLIVLP